VWRCGAAVLGDNTALDELSVLSVWLSEWLSDGFDALMAMMCAEGREIGR